MRPLLLVDSPLKQIRIDFVSSVGCSVVPLPVSARSIQSTIYLCIFHNVCGVRLSLTILSHTKIYFQTNKRQQSWGDTGYRIGYSPRCRVLYHNTLTHATRPCVRPVDASCVKNSKIHPSDAAVVFWLPFFPVTNLIIVRIKNKVKWDHKKNETNASGKVSERSI